MAEKFGMKWPKSSETLREPYLGLKSSNLDGIFGLKSRLRLVYFNLKAYLCSINMKRL